MNRKLRIALAVAGLTLAAQAGAQVTFYSGDGFRGRSFTADRNLSKDSPGSVSPSSVRSAYSVNTYR